MIKEIERKFLVDGEYKSMAYSHTRIVQGYICAERGRTVRVRLRGDQAFLTIKGGRNASGTTCLEWEKEIPADEARLLLTLCLPGVIDKTRYLVKNGRHIVEVDEFHGDNQGLVMAEIELASEDEAYETPPFIGAEVTGDPRYYNSYLSSHPYSTW